MNESRSKIIVLAALLGLLTAGCATTPKPSGDKVALKQELEEAQQRAQRLGTQVEKLTGAELSDTEELGDVVGELGVGNDRFQRLYKQKADAGNELRELLHVYREGHPMVQPALKKYRRVSAEVEQQARRCTARVKREHSAASQEVRRLREAMAAL